MKVDISYVDVRGSRRIIILASWPAPHVNPYTLATIRTPAPTNYGDLDDTVTLYTVFESISDSMTRKVSAEIDGKLHYIKWDHVDGQAVISIIVSPSNANVNRAIQSICKHLSPASNYSAYASTIRGFGVSANKDAFNAAAHSLNPDSVDIVVIGKTNSIKSDAKAGYLSKAKTLAADGSKKPGDKGSRRDLEHHSPDFGAVIHLKSPPSYIVKSYLGAIFRNFEPLICGGALNFNQSIKVEKANDADKIKVFADRMVKQLGDEISCRMADSAAGHAAFPADGIVKISKASFSKNEIIKLITDTL
jgi:hypothetical protein